MGLAVGMILGVLTIGSYAFGKVEAMGPNHQTRCPYSLSGGARPVRSMVREGSCDSGRCLRLVSN
jgi:hypothetical protein